MARRNMVPGVNFDVTPTAQQYRRSRLEPDAIRAHIADWDRRDGLGAHFAAMGLVEMTGFLQCSDTERVELIDRILDILAEVMAQD